MNRLWICTENCEWPSSNTKTSFGSLVSMKHRNLLLPFRRPSSACSLKFEKAPNESVAFWNRRLTLFSSSWIQIQQIDSTKLNSSPRTSFFVRLAFYFEPNPVIGQANRRSAFGWFLSALSEDWVDEQSDNINRSHCKAFQVFGSSNSVCKQCLPGNGCSGRWGRRAEFAFSRFGRLAGIGGSKNTAAVVD